jgi:hypothetical protein
MPKCKFVYRNHKRCSAVAIEGGDGFCAKHKPEEEEEDSGDGDVELPMPPLDERLVQENLKLKLDIDRLTNELNRLTVALNAVGEKKPRETRKSTLSEKKVWRKARFMFYREVKGNQDLLLSILNRLKSSDLIEPTATMSDIPWLNVKKVSDHMFDQKDIIEKKMYYDVAYDIFVKELKDKVNV